MTGERPYFTDLAPEEIRARLAARGVPSPERVAAAAELAVWRDLIADFRELGGRLRADLRAGLGDLFALAPLAVERVDRSETDDAMKFHFRLEDGLRIESVLIPNRGHATLCVSSQAGCALACAFCATGRLGLARNLHVREITGQFLAAQRHASCRISDVVVMGMGEPFHNYDAVMKALRILNGRFGPQIATKKLSVSTAGIAPMIRRFADDGRLYRLLVSLTAADPEKRRRLMPVEAAHPLPELLDALRYYKARVGDRRDITLEYVAIRGVNMGEDDVRALAANIRGFPFILNVIPMNPIGNDLLAPTYEEVLAFTAKLRPLGFPVKIRYSGGRDRLGGCGQLGAESLGIRRPGPLEIRPGVAITRDPD